ncbi:MAG: hypothetical protein J7L22_03690 [Candidatus Marinimicrobia bacterium]|nr:hypothetical protein [Candidatus Neomarinimicrobiota bacterium]RKY59472.1 MAG: hypothetical protein DRP96_06935 [Candidatus Neomarinimicrobiota bacterium]
MRNVGIVIFVIGLLLLVLDPTIIRIIGIIGAAFGLFALLVPDKATELAAKFKKKESDSK